MGFLGIDMDFRLKNYLFNPFSFLRIHRQMRKEAKLNKEQLLECTIGHLRDVCIYSYEHVRYYKRLFDENGINPYQINSLKSFEKIPVLDKEIVRNYAQELISDEIDKIPMVVKNETSGSTGTPLSFLCDGMQNMAVFNLFWSVWSIGGAWSIGKKQAMIGGYTDSVYKFNPINRILYMSSFHLSKSTVREYYEALRHYKPSMLRGYPSALFLFAHLLDEEGLDLHFDIIFSYAETLLSFQREYIEKKFGAKVLDQYSQQESIACICECMHGKKHAYSNFAYHEVVDTNGRAVPPGEEGRLVCTGYFNRVMPLIRYDTRDIASFAKEQRCDCGSSFPVIEYINGRIEDVVVTPEGRLVGRLDAAFKYSSNIKMSSVYQPNIDEIVVRIVLSKGTSLCENDPLIDELRKRLGDKIKITIQYVGEEDIPRTKGGKVRFVCSDVSREFE